MATISHCFPAARISDVASLDPETLGEATPADFRFRYVDLSAVKGGKITERIEEMTFADAPGRARKVVAGGDVLLGMVRPYLKPFAKVPLHEKSLVASTGFAIIRALDGKSDPEYLYQVIWSDAVSRQIHQMVTGSNYPALSVGDVQDIKIPLPPLAEQRKIAEILRTWDEAIEVAEVELKALQERKRWLMDRFLRPCLNHGQGDGAVGESVKIGDVLKVRHGKNQRAVEAPGGAYPILGTGGEIGRSNSFIYNKPSVLIGRKGTIDRPQFMETPFWTIDTLFYTEIGPRVLPLFIYYVFCSINWRQYNAATGVPSLASSAIESINLRLPALEIQAEVAKALKHCDDLSDSCASKANLLRTQKLGLMQKLLTGEVRVAA